MQLHFPHKNCPSALEAPQPTRADVWRFVALSSVLAVFVKWLVKGAAWQWSIKMRATKASKMQIEVISGVILFDFGRYSRDCDSWESQ